MKKTTFLVMLAALVALSLAAAPVSPECVTTKEVKVENGVIRNSVDKSAYCLIEFALKEKTPFSRDLTLSFEYRLKADDPKAIVIAQLVIDGKRTYAPLKANGEWQTAKLPFSGIRYESKFGGKRPEDGEIIDGLKIYGRAPAPTKLTLELRNIAFAETPLVFVDRFSAEVAFGPKVDGCPHGGHPALGTDLGRTPFDNAISRVTPVAFIWPVQPDADKYTLEFARDKEFTRDMVRKDDLRYNAYCHDQVMAKGDWYWRVRFTTKDGRQSPWSAVRRVTVAKDAVPFPMPTREALFKRIPAGHPRIIHRPEQIAELRKRVKTDLRADYERLVKLCDKILAMKTETGEPGFHRPVQTPEGAAEWRKAYGQAKRESERMTELAFGWLITGKPEYLAAARKFLADINSWNPKGATSLKHNDECGMPILRGLARTYTFLYDVLTPEERAATIKTMRVRGSEAMPRLGVNLLTRPFNSHSNRLFYFLAEAGLAFHGEIEEADEWLYLPMLYFYACYPAWGDADGGWHEGSHYFYGYMDSFLTWSDTMKNVLDLPPFTKPFFANAGYYFLYTEPPKSTGYGWGDLCEFFRPRKAAAIMRVMAAQTGNPYWAWYAEQASGNDPVPLAAYLILARAATPKVAPKAPTDLPASRLFRDSGQAVLSNTLISAEDSVQVLFKCGAQYGGSSHGYESPNTFIVNAYGDRLLVRAGTRDSYGSNFHRNYMRETKSQNNILIDGKGMCKHMLEKQGELLEFKTTPELDIVKGEAGKWYMEPIVKTYTREIRFRKPSAILVIDRLETTKSVRFDWLLHSKAPFKIANQHDIVTEYTHAASTVDFLYPEKLTVTQTDQFDPPITAPKLRATYIEHHLTATPEGKSDKACFITLIRPYRKGGQVPAKGMIVKTDKGFTVTVPMENGKVWKSEIEL